MKKLLVSLLALTMLLSVFAACGGSESGDAGTTDALKFAATVKVSGKPTLAASAAG